MQKSVLQFLLVSLILGLLLMQASRGGLGEKIDSRFVDWLSANADDNAHRAPLVLVEINDSSLGETKTWPWPPLDYALFFQAILPLNPGVIAIEPPVDWDANKFAGNEKAKIPQYENILHELLLKAPKVLLGSQLGVPDDPDVLPPMQPAPVVRNIHGNKTGIPEFTIIETQSREQFRLATTPGFTNIPDPGREIRRVPLLFRYRGEVVPSFVLQALMLWLQLPPDAIRVEMGSSINLGDKVLIPIDENGAMQVDFKCAFTRFGMDDLLLAVEMQRAKRQVDIPLANIKESITLLARTDSASHQFVFPGQHNGTPGELLASAIATIQNRAFIRHVPQGFDFTLLAWLLWIGTVFLKKSRGTATVIAIGFVVIYLLEGLMLFGALRVWIPVFMPAVLTGFMLLYRLLGATDEHRSNTDKNPTIPAIPLV